LNIFTHPKLLALLIRIGKYVNNISSLQVYNLLRFTTFLVVSILLTKKLSPKEISDFEILMFLAGLVSFFWVTGIIQSFLSLYNNNKTFPGEKTDPDVKSPEIWNAFLLLTFFSLCFVLLGLSMERNLRVFSEGKEVPCYGLLLIYVFISNPPNLIEYIYILKNKSRNVILYGGLSHLVILASVIIPVYLGYGVREAFLGLIASTIPRVLWLGYLLKRYARFRFSWAFIKTHLSLGWPLMVSTMLSGSAQYIDGVIVSNHFKAVDFAYFRYGAKEFPLVVMLAGGLHSALIPEFTLNPNLSEVLERIRKKSLRLINSLFPITLLLLFFSNWIFIHVFNPEFRRSADIFMIYLLLIISRLVFPQTILIGLKKTKVVMVVSIIAIVANILLSIHLLHIYGLEGVPLATAFVFVFEKAVLIAYNYFVLHIRPSLYMPWRLHITWSLVTILLFMLIDHRIIQVY
jgi:O-antigen/teichoic acid export membrane protein